MKLLLLIFSIVFFSCGEGQEEKLLKDQEHVNAEIDLRTKRSKATQEKMKQRGEYKIAMMRAGISKDSIEAEMRRLEFKDSIDINKWYDTTMVP